MAPALVLLTVLFIAAGRVDAGLGRIEAPGSPSATWGSLVSLDPSSEEARTEARTAWCVWFSTLPDRQKPLITQDTDKGSDPGPRVQSCLDAFTSGGHRRVFTPPTGGAEARLLIRWYVGIDAVLVLLYLLLLSRALIALRALIPQPVDPTSVSLLWAAAPSRRRLLIGALLLAEAVEDTSQWRLSAHGTTPDRIDDLYQIVGWSAVAKWALVGLAALLLLVLIARTRVLTTLPWRENLGVLRVQVFVSAVLLLLIAGVGTDQVPDIQLGLLDHMSTAVATPVAVFVLSLLLWRSVHRTALTQDKALAPVGQWWVLGAALVSAALGFTLARGLLGLAIVLGFVFFLSWIGGATFGSDAQRVAGAAKARRTTQNRADMITGRRRRSLRTTARLLAALPLLVLGVFAVRSAVAPAIVGPRRWPAALLILLGLLAALTGLVLPYLLKWAHWKRWRWAMPPSRRHSRSGLYLVLSLVCGLFVASSVATLIWDRTWNLPVWAGPMAVLSVFLGLALVGLNELQRWSERATPVPGFRALTLERTPVFVLLAAWFLIASVVDQQGHHQVRIRKAEAGSPVLSNGMDLDAAFERWAAANCATAASPADVAGDPRTNPSVPLVIVAASGGGVRAAYWTSSVLDELFPPGPVRPAAGSGCTPSDGRAPVFAASGISGGSLGAMSWIARTAPDVPGRTPSHKEVFGHDHLSGAVAWLAYVDLPRAFIGFGGKDRAAVLEQSWEHRQKELKDPFYATWQTRTATAGWTPLALLNGTAVESGCRVLTSPVQLGAFDRPVGATSCTQRPEQPRRSAASQEEPQVGGPTLIDLRGGFLCGKQDVNRSTAALLSARFPWITPSGRLVDGTCGYPGTGLSVVDGGYVEGTGSMTAVDLRERLDRVIACHNQRVKGGPAVVGCKATGGAVPARPVEVVLVQIDNGYNSVATAPSPGRPRELLVPVQGKAAAVNTTDANVRQRAYEAFGCANYLPFANVRGPGTQAPLGWVLSKSAQQDLDDQLKRLKDKASGNRLTLSGQRADTAAACRTHGQVTGWSP
ncbi:hypothetical protein OHS33_04905 [Streptomyces sp. NBC_00536]|uniref:hypothetical protein n=1 Tax=Streptomyces sp. NBC_00536 TaxID=2975769 RepID=UPI002E813CB8|nr:hypothetical protein [Streptomyces sp. NBC_00536]WUC77732.1 hypothetical protein OHS33_04905 [Streptomyces sp. NBC_00536]